MEKLVANVIYASGTNHMYEDKKLVRVHVRSVIIHWKKFLIQCAKFVEKVEICILLMTDNFICRSEWAFGSDGQKLPLIIVGLDTVKEMKAYGLKGMYYDKVYM